MRGRLSPPHHNAVPRRDAELSNKMINKVWEVRIYDRTGTVQASETSAREFSITLAFDNINDVLTRAPLIQACCFGGTLLLMDIRWFLKYL